MAMKIIFQPLHSLPFPFRSPPNFFLKPFPFPRTTPVPLLQSAAASTATSILAATAAEQVLHYGPSLRKGQPPTTTPAADPILSDEQEDDFIDKGSFSRVFELAALRVPSRDCFALESRLRGHLLNWPRIRNIARVPGDEVEDEFRNLLGDGNYFDARDDDTSLATLNRRIYGEDDGDGEPLSPVLYRDKLARTFNSRGFVKFRNLAKLSRPKKRKKGDPGEREKNGMGRNELAAVEVIEEGQEDGEDLSGLLGDEFKGRKWRGSTRLLLLDECFAGKVMDELPEAIKAVLNEGRKDESSLFELVRCKLTLFYNYWQVNEILEVLLPNGVVVPTTFETVGHIAHLNLRDEHLPFKKLIAKVVLDKNRPSIQSVVNKTDAIHNDYRTMQLEVLAGNHSLVTTVIENGLRFHVDLATVYWNSRLGTERQRLVHSFTHKDVVCDVFAGVGPISISAAKKVKHVYANDLNPYAVEYLERNCILNKVERKVEVFNMDGRRFIDVVFSNKRSKAITQVVMDLPSDAVDYLDIFRGLFRTKPKDEKIMLPKIHVYGFSKAQDPEFDFDFHERIRIALSEVAFEVQMRRVRLVAPGKWMLCASFILPESVAFAKTNSNM